MRLKLVIILFKNALMLIRLLLQIRKLFSENAIKNLYYLIYIVLINN